MRPDGIFMNAHKWKAFIFVVFVGIFFSTGYAIQIIFPESFKQLYSAFGLSLEEGFHLMPLFLLFIGYMVWNEFIRGKEPIEEP